MRAERLCHYGPEAAEKCQLRVEMAEGKNRVLPFRGRTGICGGFSENAGGAFVWRGGFAPFATFGIYRSFEFRSVRAQGNHLEKRAVLQ